MFQFRAVVICQLDLSVGVFYRMVLIRYPAGPKFFFDGSVMVGVYLCKNVSARFTFFSFFLAKRLQFNTLVYSKYNTCI